MGPITDPPPPHPHFFRSHRSSILDFHFLSHYSYIKAMMLYKGKTWQDSGILWHTLAYSGLLWHTLAYYCILWHTLAYSYSHPDLLVTQHHHHPTFSDHTGPQHWT